MSAFFAILRWITYAKWLGKRMNQPRNSTRRWEQRWERRWYSEQGGDR